MDGCIGRCWSLGRKPSGEVSFYRMLNYKRERELNSEGEKSVKLAHWDLKMTEALGEGAVTACLGTSTLHMKTGLCDLSLLLA